MTLIPSENKQNNLFSSSERRYDLRIRYVPVNFLEKFNEDRSTLLYFYQQVTSVASISISLEVFKAPLVSSVLLPDRFATITCSFTRVRSAMGWLCSWAVWRSGESPHSTHSFTHTCERVSLHLCWIKGLTNAYLCVCVGFNSTIWPGFLVQEVLQGHECQRTWEKVQLWAARVKTFYLQ